MADARVPLTDTESSSSGHIGVNEYFDKIRQEELQEEGHDRKYSVKTILTRSMTAASCKIDCFK